jgi:hypothetical protein
LIAPEICLPLPLISSLFHILFPFDVRILTKEIVQDHRNHRVSHKFSTYRSGL